jgi:MIP family channel proteins
MSGDYVWKALLAEFIGTFILVFIGASAVALTVAQGGNLLVSAFAFGLALMTLIYIWGSYSGAHFNPAVSFGFAVAGQMNWGLMLGYWVAQLLGAIAAGALVAYFFGTASGAGASVGSLTFSDVWRAVLLEAFLTMFLVFAYLFIYRNPFLAIISGIAIGLVLTFTFLAGGALTGASLNPARTLGTAIFSNNIGTWWIYIVGPLLGALVAALIYKLFVTDFSCCDKVDECGNRIKDECGRGLKECKKPLVDNCGREIKDCHGNVQYKTYIKHERVIHHMQETPLMAIGEWMSGHGFDPRYIRQEVSGEMDKYMPGGVVENPQAVVDGAISAFSPKPAGSTVLVSTTPAVEREVVVPVTSGASEVFITPLSQRRVVSEVPVVMSPTVLSPQSTIVSVARPATVQPVTIMSTQPTQGFVPTLQAATMDALRVPTLSPIA